MLQVMTITIAQKEEASVWNQLWENQPIPVASPITGNSSVIINLHRIPEPRLPRCAVYKSLPHYISEGNGFRQSIGPYKSQNIGKYQDAECKFNGKPHSMPIFRIIGKNINIILQSHKLIVGMNTVPICKGIPYS